MAEGPGSARSPAIRSVLLLGLRVSGVFEVCGAFGGRVLGEDFTAGVGDAFVTSRPDLSQQGLELGEDLFDGVEVGGVFRQEYQAGSDIPDCLAHRLSLWDPRLSRMTTSPGFSVGTRN